MALDSSRFIPLFLACTSEKNTPKFSQRIELVIAWIAPQRTPDYLIENCG